MKRKLMICLGGLMVALICTACLVAWRMVA